MQPDKRHTSLKKQLECLTPLLEDLRLKKEERIKQLADVKTQIDKINAEILGHFHLHSNGVEEHDLSLRKLNEYRTHLQTLQNEKVYLVNLLLSTYVLTTCFSLSLLKGCVYDPCGCVGFLFFINSDVSLLIEIISSFFWEILLCVHILCNVSYAY